MEKYRVSGTFYQMLGVSQMPVLCQTGVIHHPPTGNSVGFFCKIRAGQPTKLSSSLNVTRFPHPRRSRRVNNPPLQMIPAAILGHPRPQADIPNVRFTAFPTPAPGTNPRTQKAPPPP